MKTAVPTFLVAEDDADDFLFFERAVAREFEADLRRARDGEEAITYLKGEGEFADRVAFPLPDLVVLDLKMPRVNGFEVLTWLRAHEHLGSLPVVIFTSSDDPGDMERAKALGVAAYLVKPTSILAYSQVVKSLRELWMAAIGVA